jgi:catechol 2,3-dioxygenase-like lactoylglutathione lyase family enzyme
MKLLRAAIIVGALASPAFAQLTPPNEAGLTYGHVHLNVRDLESTKKLYAEQFGGVIVEKGILTVVKFPNLLLALTKREPTGGSMGTVMDHFGFKVRDLSAHLVKWRAAGYRVTEEFIGAEGAPNAYLMGPDDARIELQEDKTLAVPVMGYHIHFITPDHVKLLDWYADVFGLKRRTRGKIETTVDAPGMNLSFGTANAPTAATRGRAIDHIGFEIRNLEAFCKKLAARGIAFDMPFRDVPSVGLKAAFITDPSGVSIELTEGYDKY